MDIFYSVITGIRIISTIIAQTSFTSLLRVLEIISVADIFYLLLRVLENTSAVSLTDISLTRLISQFHGVTGRYCPTKVVITVSQKVTEP